MYKQLIDNLIDNYGDVCTVYPGGGGDDFTIRAFVNPMRYRYGNFGGVTYRESGAFDEREYLFVGKSENDLSRLPEGSLIECSGKMYRTDSCELYTLGGSPLYIRAVLRPYEGGILNE